jgi:hypothetical protein
MSDHMGDIVNFLGEQAEIEAAGGNRTCSRLCRRAASEIASLRSKIGDLEPDVARLTAIIQAQADEIRRLRGGPGEKLSPASGANSTEQKPSCPTRMTATEG